MKVNYCPRCSGKMEVEFPPILADVCFCLLKCPRCGKVILLSDEQAVRLSVESKK